MDTERAKAIVRRLYDEVLTGGRLETADELLAPGFTSHDGPGAHLSGPEVIKVTRRTLAGAFSDLRFEILDLLAENDRVAARWRMRGTHTGEFVGLPPTGKPIRQEAIVLFRLEGDRLAELWAKLDGSLTDDIELPSE